jgi:DNA-binding PadR family transcriptional regulator
MNDDAEQHGGPGEPDEGMSLREMREQMRQLQEEARRLQEEARQRAEEERELARQERERAREERDREREERLAARETEREQNRAERDRRRSGRRNDGFGFGHLGGPVGPAPLPPLPPLPPIAGAGGTFTPFDLLAGVFGTATPPKRPRGRGRAGRGDVRITILLLLDEAPANGYQLMQEIEQRTGGAWKPSSGSIYPALQLLEDEGIVKTVEGEGRKMFALTDDGRRYVAERRDDWIAPWENLEEEEGVSEEAARVRDLVGQLAMAYMQVMQVGTEGQRGEAARVLTGARQAMYRILAGDSSAE